MSGCPLTLKHTSYFVTAIKVFRYSFWETIPMFFNLLKSDFILATKFLLVIDYELLFVKMQLFVKSISPWQQQTKTFQVDKSRILCDLDLPLKMRHQELKVWCLASNLREKYNILYVWIEIKRKYNSNLIFSIAVITCLLIRF